MIVFNDKFNGECIDITGKSCIDKWINGSYRNFCRGLSSEINIPVEELEIYPEWYKLQDGLYYFKQNKIFNEVLACEIFKYFGLRCVDYSFARDGNYTGIISKNFRNPEYEYFYYNDLVFSNRDTTVDNFENICSLTTLMTSASSAHILMRELSILLAIDFFLGEGDRKNYNLLFERDNDSIHLAPVCDNGEIFYGPSDSIETCYGKVSLPGRSKCFNNDEFDTLMLISCNTEFRRALINTLNIDINQILKDVIEKYSIDMSSSNGVRIINYFDDKKAIIDNTLKLIL